MEQQDNIFSTKDYYLSSVLLAFDCSLSHLDRSPGDFVFFVFDKSPEECHELIASYWAGELRVDPKKLIEAINQLKTRLHEGV